MHAWSERRDWANPVERQAPGWVPGTSAASRLPMDLLMRVYYECDSVPTVFSLCISHFKILNFWETLGTSKDQGGRKAESITWWKYTCWKMTFTCWRPLSEKKRGGMRWAFAFAVISELVSLPLALPSINTHLPEWPSKMQVQEKRERVGQVWKSSFISKSGT